MINVKNIRFFLVLDYSVANIGQLVGLCYRIKYEMFLGLLCEGVYDFRNWPSCVAVAMVNNRCEK